MTALVMHNKKKAQSSDGAAGGRAQYLTFICGGEAYAIGILAIKEIIEFGGMTEVPMMPASVRGVINLRGAVVPVMDLAVRLGRRVSDVTKRTCIVIVEIACDGEQQVFGVLVDSVSAVLEIPDAEIEPAPLFGARIPSHFIAGMSKVNCKFVILLDVARALAMDEIAQLAEAGAAAADGGPA